MRFISNVTTALAAMWLLGTLTGIDGAQTKSCFRNCLVLNANQTAQGQVKSICRAACNAVRPLRHACLDEAKVLYRGASNACSESLRLMNRGLPPLNVSVGIGHSRDGNVLDQILTYNYKPNCRQVIRSLYTQAKVSTILRFRFIYPMRFH